MRHKYATTGMVLSRIPISEAGMLVTILTPELGLVRARAEGLRRSGAKLAHALQTLNEADVMLVRGKEGWRLVGAVLGRDYFSQLSPGSRMRVARIASLLLRLVHGESGEPELHGHLHEFIDMLSTLTEEEQADAESLMVLRLLRTLGVDAGEAIPDGYTPSTLTYAEVNRTALIARINRGISASGL